MKHRNPNQEQNYPFLRLHNLRYPISLSMALVAFVFSGQAHATTGDRLSTPNNLALDGFYNPLLNVATPGSHTTELSRPHRGKIVNWCVPKFHPVYDPQGTGLEPATTSPIAHTTGRQTFKASIAQPSYINDGLILRVYSPKKFRDDYIYTTPTDFAYRTASENYRIPRKSCFEIDSTRKKQRPISPDTPTLPSPKVDTPDTTSVNNPSNPEVYVTDTDDDKIIVTLGKKIMFRPWCLQDRGNGPATIGGWAGFGRNLRVIGARSILRGEGYEKPLLASPSIESWTTIDTSKSQVTVQLTETTVNQPDDAKARVILNAKVFNPSTGAITAYSLYTGLKKLCDANDGRITASSTK